MYWTASESTAEAGQQARHQRLGKHLKDPGQEYHEVLQAFLDERLTDHSWAQSQHQK